MEVSMTKMADKIDNLKKQMEKISTPMCILLATVEDTTLCYGVDAEFWVLGATETGNIDALRNTGAEFQKKIYRKRGNNYDVKFSVVGEDVPFCAGGALYIE